MYSRSEWTQLHFHFIMNAIFSYLVYTYFLNIFQVFFFFTFYVRAFYPLALSITDLYIFLCLPKQGKPHS